MLIQANIFAKLIVFKRSRSPISPLTLPARVDAELGVKFLVSLRFADGLHVNRVLVHQIQSAVSRHRRLKKNQATSTDSDKGEPAGLRLKWTRHLATVNTEK